MLSKQTGRGARCRCFRLFHHFQDIGFQTTFGFRCLHGLGVGCFAAPNAIRFLNSCHINDVMLYNNNLFEI